MEMSICTFSHALVHISFSLREGITIEIIVFTLYSYYKQLEPVKHSYNHVVQADNHRTGGQPCNI